MSLADKSISICKTPLRTKEDITSIIAELKVIKLELNSKIRKLKERAKYDQLHHSICNPPFSRLEIDPNQVNFEFTKSILNSTKLAKLLSYRTRKEKETIKKGITLEEIEFLNEATIRIREINFILRVYEVEQKRLLRENLDENSSNVYWGNSLAWILIGIGIKRIKGIFDQSRMIFSLLLSHKENIKSKKDKEKFLQFPYFIQRFSFINQKATITRLKSVSHHLLTFLNHSNETGFISNKSNYNPTT